MKTLNRLRHIRTPDQDQLSRFRLEDDRAATQRERRRWLYRLKRLVPGFVVAGLLFAGGYWIFTLNVVAEAIVQTNLMIVRAPGTVRIVEVFCEPGQYCKKGEPLLHTVSTVGYEERWALEMMVQKHRLRLSLVKAGGELENSDLAKRGDWVAEAEREALLAGADFDVATAKLERLIREMDASIIAFEKEDRSGGGKVESLKEKLNEANAMVEQARAEKQWAEYDAENYAKLHASGVVPDRDMRMKRTAQDATTFTMDSLSSSAKALQKELKTAQLVQDLTRRQNEAELAEMAARINEAKCEIETARARRDLWSELADRRGELLPGDGMEWARLRELEISLLKTELAEAEALLGKLDRELGNLVIKAEFDGVIDQVYAEPGIVMDMDTPLVSYFDPARRWITAYATPEVAGEDLAGRECTLVPENGRPALKGRVASIGMVWVPCPPQLPQGVGPAPDLRLPVRIECEDREGLKAFRPNARMRAVFRRRGADE
jgi:multidrug resistance efflux pump